MTDAQANINWTTVWRQALPAAPARVLDVGTGTGHVSLLLAELGYDVTGIDLAEDMLTTARAKAAVLANPPDLRLGDAVAPDFPPASFDVVTCWYVLWTLRSPEDALRNWRTLLRPGGLLAAVDSTWFPAGIEGTVDPVRAAGFTHVTVTALPEIPDRRPDGHETGPQFVITARSPWHDRGYLPATFG